MSNLTDFFPSGGGGGLTPKFQEFNSSGIWTVPQALIDAGGYVEVFLVGAGGTGSSQFGGAGGEVISFHQYLTNQTTVAIYIGASVTGNGVTGNDSSWNALGAGGSNVTALGGSGNGYQGGKLGAGFGSTNSNSLPMSAGSGTLGYGAGGSLNNASSRGGVGLGKANSGQGSNYNSESGSGYCLIKWYE
jgi:hypothetical protein